MNHSWKHGSNSGDCCTPRTFRRGQELWRKETERPGSDFTASKNRALPYFTKQPYQLQPTIANGQLPAHNEAILAPDGVLVQKKKEGGQS
jgi:hypothetical protein